MEEYIKKSGILAEIETAIETGRLSTVSGSQLYRWVLQLDGLRVDARLQEQDEFDTLAHYVEYLRHQAAVYKALAACRLSRCQDYRDLLMRVRDLCDREIIG